MSYIISVGPDMLYISSMCLDIRHVAEIVVEWVKTLVLGIPRDRMAVENLEIQALH